MAPKQPKPPDERLRLPEDLVDWINSPKERELRERARGLGIKVDLSPPTARKRKRKKGKQGRPPKLAPEEIVRGKQELLDHPRLKTREQQLGRLRKALNKRKSDVSDSVLLRDIILPVRRSRRSK
jgi:hypothetical protein